MILGKMLVSAPSAGGIDGRYMLCARSSGSLFRSEDYGNTWIAVTALGSKSWSHCGISGDGKYQSAQGSNQVYISKDYGVTWQIGPSNTRNIGWSSDGQYSIYGTSFGAIISSSDYGETLQNWNQGSSSYIKYPLVSGSGECMTGAVSSGSAYISRDYGVSHQGINMSTYANYPSISFSGQYLNYTIDHYAYLSSNYGASFTAKYSGGVSRYFRGSCMSSDGRLQYLLDDQGGIHCSADYGQTWSYHAVLPLASMAGLSCSGDGRILLSVKLSSGYAYVSYDFGMTWNQRLELGNWSGFSTTVNKYAA